MHSKYNSRKYDHTLQNYSKNNQNNSSYNIQLKSSGKISNHKLNKY